MATKKTQSLVELDKVIASKDLFSVVDGLLPRAKRLAATSGTVGYILVGGSAAGLTGMMLWFIVALYLPVSVYFALPFIGFMIAMGMGIGYLRALGPKVIEAEREGRALSAYVEAATPALMSGKRPVVEEINSRIGRVVGNKVEELGSGSIIEIE